MKLLGKVRPADAAFYVLAQFIGIAAVWLLGCAIAPWLMDPSVRYVATVAGNYGVATAFIAELVISCILMLVVLSASNSRRLASFTGLFAGALVATYIIVESPISGMSMNPARSLASALPARLWTALWIYFSAPVIGMLLAAETYVRLRGSHAVLCAKLHHKSCGYLSPQ